MLPKPLDSMLALLILIALFAWWCHKEITKNAGSNSDPGQGLRARPALLDPQDKFDLTLEGAAVTKL